MCGRGKDVVSAMAAKNTLIGRKKCCWGGEEKTTVKKHNPKITCIRRIEAPRFFFNGDFIHFRPSRERTVS